MVVVRSTVSKKFTFATNLLDEDRCIESISVCFQTVEIANSDQQVWQESQKFEEETDYIVLEQLKALAPLRETSTFISHRLVGSTKLPEAH